jgi:uncharacterized membrane protein (DUF485 family)
MTKPSVLANEPPDAKPDVRHIDDCTHTSARNARVGLVLFAVYLALYGGFMGLSAFAREQMARPVLAGVNLAIVYGFGLIAAALVLSLVYMALCHAPAAGSEMGETEKGTSRPEERR